MIALPFLSERGVPQNHWVRVGMPQIPPSVTNSVFFLYDSVESAKSGERPGGTGFIVAYSDSPLFPAETAFYGVTNWHVACEGGCSVIRLNTKDGGTDIIEIFPEQWEFIPGRYDLAAVRLQFSSIHDVSAVNIGDFVIRQSTQTRIKSDVGIGEDVFMIGLFIDHFGKGVNIPSARFGHISMLPDERALIKQPTTYDGVSYLIDIHSRAGFSGSPVYVYRTFGSDLKQKFGESINGLDLQIDSIQVDDLGRPGGRTSGRVRGSRGTINYNGMLKLLGIYWGRFPEQAGAPGSELSGTGCVIPAWQILELLNIPALAAERERKTAAFNAALQKVRDGSTPVTK
ncbi:serine protease [Methylocystis sp. Sn-Cys]|uniref:S1 family peptidase n=1 Tax=Methylocystis sp. Sn-Cys TaxID=1701263 RepID=UPI001921ED09|nr:serine protease [Methylocystis sp. Sn-Cys]MBL1255854.1 trypsin-like peptidase domain-containing protein [Methylocystis sp. Sn-Cys]